MQKPDHDLLDHIEKALNIHKTEIKDLKERVEKLEMAYLRDHTHFGKEITTISGR